MIAKSKPSHVSFAAASITHEAGRLRRCTFAPERLQPTVGPACQHLSWPNIFSSAQALF
jgi:hypothetical protein